VWQIATFHSACRIGYYMQAMMVAATQSSTGRRNMKLQWGIVLMELVSKMEKIYFVVLRNYIGIWGHFNGSGIMW
jgi:hypothetical protein